MCSVFHNKLRRLAVKQVVTTSCSITNDTNTRHKSMTTTDFKTIHSALEIISKAVSNKKKELRRRKHPPNELKIDDETEFKVKQVLIVFMIVSNSDDIAYNIVCACVASLFDWLFNSCSSGRFLIEIYNKRNKQQIKLYKICIGICFLNFTLSNCGWMAVVGRV